MCWCWCWCFNTKLPVPAVPVSHPASLTLQPRLSTGWSTSSRPPSSSISPHLVPKPPRRWGWWLALRCAALRCAAFALCCSNCSRLVPQGTYSPLSCTPRTPLPSIPRSPLPQLERARRLAAQYAAAALQSRPKLKLHLVLDAPKVAIPAADAQGRATLALDFGRFIIQSGAATHSQAVCLANRRSG